MAAAEEMASQERKTIVTTTAAAEELVVVRLNSNGPSSGRCVETVADEAVVEKRRSSTILGKVDNN